MILSRRERYIVIGTVAVVGLLALDRLFLTPLIERRQVIDAQMRQASWGRRALARPGDVLALFAARAPQGKTRRGRSRQGRQPMKFLLPLLMIGLLASTADAQNRPDRPTRDRAPDRPAPGSSSAS